MTSGYAKASSIQNQNKWQNNKLDFIIIKNFCSSREYCQEKEKGNPQDGRKYLQIISDKGIASRIYLAGRGSTCLYSQRLVSDVFFFAGLYLYHLSIYLIYLYIERCFSKEDRQTDNKHMERCSTLLVIRKIHTKATMRSPLGSWITII